VVHESAFGTLLRSLRRNRLSLIGTTTDKGAAQILNRYAAFDPTATLAVRCGNGFDAGFSPYQSTRLSRYNPVS
jgi:hypothetical protein